MSDNTEAERKAEALKQKLADANAKMTDQRLADRVRAAHPNAAQSEEGIAAMVADYERAAEEAKKPYGGGSTDKPTNAQPAPSQPGQPPGHRE